MSVHQSICATPWLVAGLMTGVGEEIGEVALCRDTEQLTEKASSSCALQGVVGQ